jgi:glycosyltransferase A (GT-A) superfamily protein (DUF2064 family)
MAAINGSIVVVAKCPIPGKSKTRLIPLLGEHGSVALAKAMLSDILLNLTSMVCEREAWVHNSCANREIEAVFYIFCFHSRSLYRCVALVLETILIATKL